MMTSAESLPSTTRHDPNIPTSFLDSIPHPASASCFGTQIAHMPR